ncbi:MAG TPA: hypothetical protein VGN12_03550 [Pirellulales bacterium]|jgi:hypothetical protein
MACLVLSRQTRHAATALLALLLLVIASGCAQPPQFAQDEDAWQTADALWTAITAKDTTLLDQCAAKLTALHTDGKLSQPAFEHFEHVIATARDGNWDKARKTLKKSVKAQRRIVRELRND